MNKIFPTFVLLTFLMTGCQENGEDTLSIEKVVVVESFLAPGQPASIKLSSVIPFTTDTTTEIANAISGMEVSISTGDLNYDLFEMTDTPGTYEEPTKRLVIEEGETYQLQFVYQDMEVIGSTQIPLKPGNFEISDTLIKLPRVTEDSGLGGMPSMTEIELTWDNDESDYYLLTIQYMEEEYDTINTVFEIEDAEAAANFSSQPLQVNFYSIRSMQFSFFGRYQIVLSHINPEYARLFETLSQSSLEGLTEPESNVINGKGIFTSYNSDTLWIDVLEE
jgi:hypothetical protein